MDEKYTKSCLLQVKNITKAKIQESYSYKKYIKTKKEKASSLF